MCQKKAHRTKARRNEPSHMAGSDICLWAQSTTMKFLTALPWARITGMKFNKSKCWILLGGQSNTRHKHILQEEWLESSPAQRNLGVLVGSQKEAWTLFWSASPAGQKRLFHCIQCRCGVTSRNCALEKFLGPAVEEGLWMHPEEGNKTGGIGWKECAVILSLSYLE